MFVSFKIKFDRNLLDAGLKRKVYFWIDENRWTKNIKSNQYLKIKSVFIIKMKSVFYSVN